MNSKKVEIENRHGDRLAARLEMPISGKTMGSAIFAHCFTCSKDLNAVRNISRALAMNGIAVLRFDFTGLGASEGEFSESTFSRNISDLEDVAKFMEKELEAPSMLVGHSLGGAAVLFAAERIGSVKAVVTIAAPSSPSHVKHHFKDGEEEVLEKGKGEVNIGGRKFKITDEFIRDFDLRSLNDVMDSLKDKAVLVMHSPQDKTVEIENAAEIYKAAHHPKSFISLDGADHLLSEKEDSIYVGEVISTWVKRYIDLKDDQRPERKGQVYGWLGGDGFTTEIQAGNHGFLADEPRDMGGDDLGPSPYELVSSGLAACTSMTLKMYSERKEWPLEEVVVHVDHEKVHKEDMDECDNGSKKKIDRFTRLIEVKGDLSDEQKDKLLEIANKCPVHRTLHNEIEVKTTMN